MRAEGIITPFAFTIAKSPNVIAIIGQLHSTMLFISRATLSDWPPSGKKSFSPFVPKYKFGLGEVSNKGNPCVGIIIESALGLKNLDELLNNSCLDFVYFGAYDLSVELNIPGEIFSDEIKDKLILLNEKAKKFDIKVFSIYRNLEELKFLQSLNIEYPISLVDTSHLANILKQKINEFHLTK